MTTSASQNYNNTRNQIITNALRIVGAIGEGETPTSSAIADGTWSLLNVITEMNTDGMPLWAMYEREVTPLVSGTATYTVGTGQTYNFPAPLKIIQAFLRDSTTDYDTPVLLIDHQRYLLLGMKTASGVPNQLWYQTPRAIQSGGEQLGVITLYPTPDAYTAANKSLWILGQKPFDDFDSASDTLDFPPYWIRAVTWAVAEDLAYEYGLGLAERSMIAKKAERHKQAALSFGTEEGSLYLMPEPRWDQSDVR